MKGEYDLSKKLMNNVGIRSLSIVIGCSSLWLSACVYAPPIDARPNRPFHEIKEGQNLEAAKFNKEFALAVTEADTVIVREHSHVSDLNSSLTTRTKIPRYTYIEKELNFNERMSFVKDVQKLKGRARNITTVCLFEPHHSIELYRGGKLTSVMQMSYNCGEIKWDGSRGKASGDMFDAVTPLLKRCGMKVHRDWQSKAEDKFVDGNTGSVPDKPDSSPSPDLANPILPGQVPTAKWILGEEGKKVTNPFTGGVVDVEDIPAGIKVRDPNDENVDNIFRCVGHAR